MKFKAFQIELCACATLVSFVVFRTAHPQHIVFFAAHSVSFAATRAGVTQRSGSSGCEGDYTAHNFDSILLCKSLDACTLSLHTATAPAIRAAVKTVVSCQCSRLRFRMLQLKTEETPVFCVCKQKQEFIATEAI